MSFFEKIKEFGLDPSSIQNGLKNIGVDFTKYKLEVETISEDLVNTLKKIVAVAKTASRQDKMYLRSNFESALKGKEIKVREKISEEKPGVKPAKIKLESRNQDWGKSKTNVPWWGNQKLKIGRVKFFDVDKGFGFIESYDDKKDCFGHISHLEVPIITEGDIVNFESGPSKKKEGELAAYSINTQFELFVDIDPKSKKSVATILSTRHFEQSFPLNDKVSMGFYVATAKQFGNGWKITIRETESVDPKTKLNFSKQIVNKYIEQIEIYRDSIGRLIEFLWEQTPPEEKNEIISKLQSAITKIQFSDLDKFINSFTSFDLFKTVFNKECRELSPVSYILWRKEIQPSLPIGEPTTLTDILSKINVKEITSVITKLIEEDYNLPEEFVREQCSKLPELKQLYEKFSLIKINEYVATHVARRGVHW